MFTALTIFAAPVLASVAAAPVATEPVLEWAARDLRRHRSSQVGLLVSTLAPGLILVGVNAAQSFSAEKDPEGHAAGVALALTGGAGLLVGPPLLLVGATGSARALRSQGLEVSTTAGAVGLGVDLAAVAGVGGALALAGEEGSLDLAVVIGSAGYLGAVGLGALQNQVNHRHRRDAGWLGWRVVPKPGDGPGVLVAGTF